MYLTGSSAAQASNKNSKFSKLTMRDYIEYLVNNMNKGEILVNDILNLNIIQLDEKLNYIRTVQKYNNFKYIVLQVDKNKRFKNITIEYNEEKFSLLDKNSDMEIINGLQTEAVEISEITNVTETNTGLDTIIEDIENSNYSKKDFLSNIELLD